MTEVYLVDISKLKVEKYVNKLPVNFFVEASKYTELNQKKRSFFGWYLLYCILSDKGYNIDRLNIEHNEHGKPLINRIHFNISHSNDLVGVVISDESCGLDIEHVDGKDRSAIAKVILTEDKYEKYLEDDSIFYQEWTKKEAYLKHAGTGLKISDLKKVDVELSTQMVTIKKEEYWMSVIPESAEVRIVKFTNRRKRPFLKE